MGLVEINRDPDERTLRQFGRIAAVAVPALTWWFTRPVGVTATMVVAIGVGLAALIAAQVRPCVLKHPFVGLSLATAPIGLIVGELVTLVMFFVVLMPLGLVFRALGRNPLDWRFRRDATTYWTMKSQPRDAASYFRQF